MQKIAIFCHFHAKIVKPGLILTHLSLFARGDWGKKIFGGEKCPPMPLCGTATAFVAPLSCFMIINDDMSKTDCSPLHKTWLFFYEMKMNSEISYKNCFFFFFLWKKNEFRNILQNFSVFALYTVNLRTVMFSTLQPICCRWSSHFILHGTSPTCFNAVRQ